MADKEETVKRRWIQMGIELEGSWGKSLDTVASTVRGATVHQDQSVRVGYAHDGEIVTRPTAKLDELCDDVLKLYPDRVNDSCGLHIHASFTPMDTSLLASSDFFYYYKDRWAKWGSKMKLPREHEFWARLRGKSKFAMDKFTPEQQLVVGAGNTRENRYTMLNFCAWEKHKTLESRLLPMFSDPQVAIAAIREQSDIYDAYLAAHSIADVVFEFQVREIGGEIVETYEGLMPDTTPAARSFEDTYEDLPSGPGIFYSIPNTIMRPFQEELGLQSEP